MVKVGGLKIAEAILILGGVSVRGFDVDFISPPHQEEEHLIYYFVRLKEKYLRYL